MTKRSEDWDNVAGHLRAARGERSLREVAAACNTIEGAIVNLEEGHPPKYGIPAVLHRLVAYYGWTEDSVHEMLCGRDPTPRSQGGHGMT